MYKNRSTNPKASSVASAPAPIPAKAAPGFTTLKRVYLVREGHRFGAFNVLEEGEQIELTAAEAAPFLDLLELRDKPSKPSKGKETTAPIAPPEPPSEG